jgi:hypothetical protein
VKQQPWWTHQPRAIPFSPPQSSRSEWSETLATSENHFRGIFHGDPSLRITIIVERSIFLYLILSIVCWSLERKYPHLPIFALIRNGRRNENRNKIFGSIFWLKPKRNKNPFAHPLYNKGPYCRGRTERKRSTFLDFEKFLNYKLLL